MAATMHAKMNRKKLSKLNIIKICEEILNPTVPMALRLSGILMGGVVIVYERKVEINEAWKVKSVPDPTLLPKGKTQAKYEAVTLPDNQETEVWDVEQSNMTTHSIMGFQQTGYFAMRLDSVDEPFINIETREEEQPADYHQADPANITLFEGFDSYQTDADFFNRFERFDIEGDEETQLISTSLEHIQIQSTIIPSPPRPTDPPRPDEVQDQHPEYQVNKQSEGGGVTRPQQDHHRQGPRRRKARKPAASAMDYEQTIIPGHIYQSWLQSGSDIVGRIGRKRKRVTSLLVLKISKLMELPPLILICGLSTENGQIHYPAPLLELWTRSTQPPHDSPSSQWRTSPPQPPEPSSSSSPLDTVSRYNGSVGFAFEDFRSGVDSQSVGGSLEKQRANVINNELPKDLLNATDNGVKETEVTLCLISDAGDEEKFIHILGSGHGYLSNNLEFNSGRSHKKRPYSASLNSGSDLEPVAEESPWCQRCPEFELTRLSENCLAPENDFLVETGPTQSPHPVHTPQPIDKITDSIRMQLKTHFDNPGSDQKESLNQLAFGMSKRSAAQLFYHTCVLATREFIKVEQGVAYGDILISRGAKM
ncbi:hypothetical protein NMG60_11011989 [Bertholletia excelsa]